MSSEIVIIKDGKAYRIEAPESVKIWNGDRALDCDFDMVSLDGEFFLSKHVLEMARTGEKGFRLIGFEPLPDE
jgi:hypothetical protein